MQHRPASPRALLAGYFSTLGDYDSLEVVRRWLEKLGIPHDVLAYDRHIRERLPTSVHPDDATPERYSHLLVVCGPCAETFYAERCPIDLNDFAHCRIVGLNLSMIDSLDRFMPFDALFERDSDRTARPDLTFLWERPLLPVVGMCQVGRQREYGAAQRHGEAAQKIDALLAAREVCAIPIDTRWGHEDSGFRTPAQIETLFARMDVVVTTRLHGMVYALKHGVPAVVIDAIAGGAKVQQQARALDWPWVYTVDELTAQDLEAAFDECLTPEARARAAACARDAREHLVGLEVEVARAMREPVPERAGTSIVTRRERRRRLTPKWLRRHR